MLKMRNLMTHGAAVLAGIAFAAAFSHAIEPTEEHKASVDSTVKAPVRRTAREVVIRPRDLLRSLAKVPMERYERDALKRDIYVDWAKRDPLGFLNYFEHRPWPGFFSGEGPFEVLAKTQPEELLAYARRTGCTEAAKTLVEKGDLYRVLEILGADGLAHLPEDELRAFVRRGESADPNFHERLAMITDEATRKLAFENVADGMESAGRLDDLLAFVSQNPDAFEDRPIGRNIAKLLLKEPDVLERLDEIPEALRVETAKAMISSFNDDEVSEDGRREILTGLASRGLIKDSGMEVFETIAERGDDLSPEVLEDWKTWAMDLPPDELMRPLRLASMAMWSYGSHAGPDQWTTLPPGEMRDAAVIGGVGFLMEKEKNMLGAKQLAGQIEDAKLRTNFLNYIKLAETGDEPREFDPFGFGDTAESTGN